MGNVLEAAIGVLNGTVGDWLARSGNGLATPMELVHDGERLPVERASLARAHPSASPRVVVLVHGLMCTERIWGEPGEDYGALLERDLGYTPLYVRFNSGLAIAESGAAFAALMEKLVAEWPVPITEIVPLGFSMGGLVVRSACHVATGEGHAWLALVRRAIYVGTPHRGAPLERVGRLATRILGAIPDPYTQLIAEIADLRSAGIKDLGDADLRHEDRTPRITLRDREHPVPLLPGIEHVLLAGTLSEDPRLATFFGDTVVPVPSGTNGGVVPLATSALPPRHVKLFPRVTHMTLAHHPDVYVQIRSFCEEKRTS